MQGGSIMKQQRRITLWTAIITLIFAAVAMILLQTAAAKAGPSDPGERAVQAVWHNIEQTEYTGAGCTGKTEFQLQRRVLLSLRQQRAVSGGSFPRGF